MECNATEIWCDAGYYNDNQCWYGNYCLQQVNEWDGCPGMCHMPCYDRFWQQWLWLYLL